MGVPRRRVLIPFRESIRIEDICTHISLDGVYDVARHEVEVIEDSIVADKRKELLGQWLTCNSIDHVALKVSFKF